MAERSSSRFSSKYSSSKRYVTSTEISYADHSSKSSYQKESSMEYTSPKGVTSSTKETVSASDIRTLPVYITIREHKTDPKDRDALPLDEGQIVEVLDSKNASAWLVRTKSRPPQTGWVPGSYFETPAEYYRQKRSTREITNGDLHMSTKDEALAKRDAVFRELLKTEEDFVQELHHVINTYVKIFDDPATPSVVRQLREQLTLNLRELYNFHANVLLKGLQYYSDNPGKVGQTFVRLERDFDQHVRYCRDEPDTEKLLEDLRLKDHLQKIISQVETDTDKKFLDYLRLPIKRMQQYQAYIKELIKYTARAELETENLQKALELMLSIPQRATDLNYIRNIQDYPGDTVKLGRLLRHEQFKVWENEKSGEGEVRYVFLFKSKLVFTQRTEPEDLDELPEFKYINTIRLDRYEIKEDPNEPDSFAFTPLDANLPKFYLKSSDAVNASFSKQAWVKEVAEAKEGLVIVDDEINETMTEFVDMSDVKSEFSEYSTASRKSSVYGGPDEGPPRKKPKSPPTISQSGSSGSLYSSTGDLTAATTSGTLEMQGTRVTRTQYGFRTLQESSAKMCLKVSGFPLPIITWFKDGVQLNEDERHKFYSDDEGFFAMTIDPVLVEDTGRYTCVATNEYGSATTSAFFRVVKVEKEPMMPKFISSLQDVEVLEGSSASFECEVEGWPEPEIQFFIDGQVIHPSHDFKIEYDGQKASLVIRDVQPEDAGIYSIRVTNEVGIKESKAKLSVREDPEKNKVPPEFQSTLEDKTVDEGETVKFKVVITGDPAPEVSWYINGGLLTESENIKFLAEDGIYIVTIKNITMHFDGELTCRAINRLGDVSCSGRLTVRSKGYAPSFEQPLTDQSVSVNGKVKFEVAVAAEPDATITWFLNGKELKESKNVKIISRASAGVFSVEILKADSEMTGEIECRASNDIGETSSKAKLNVGAAQTIPTVKEGLKDITVKENESLKIQITVDGEPKPVVKWLLNGKELKESSNVKIISKEKNIYSLEIVKITSDFSGTLECTIENEAGTTSSQSNINVESSKKETAPVVKKELPKDVNVKENETFKLEVEVEPDSQPTKVTWSVNNKDIKESTNIKIVTSSDKTKSSLVVEKASSDMQGEIVCKVENKTSTVVTKTEVKIETKSLVTKDVKPTIKENLPKETTAKVGESVTLTVAVDAEPDGKALWTVNGKEVKDTDKNVQISSPQKGTYQLTINEIKSDMSGEISCKVENKSGSVKASTKLKVEPAEKPAEKPTADQKVKKQESTSEMIIESSEERVEITKTTQVTKTSVTEVDGQVTSEVTEYSESHETLSKYSPMVVQELKDVMVAPGEPIKLELKVGGQPAPDVKWLFNGKEIKESSDVKITSTSSGVHTLEILKSTVDWHGEIECKITNEIGEKICKANLAVVKRKIAAKPEFQSKLAPVTVAEGDTMKAKIIVSGDEPKVKWYINDKIVVQTEDVKMIAEDGIFILEIQGASSNMTGTIRCTAYNSRGEVTCTAPITVTTGVPVEFEQYLCDTSCREGDTLKLKAVLLGEPSPDVTWYINGKRLDESQNIKIFTEKSTYIVVIHNITCDMSGQVVCKAVNEYGEASSSAQLTVLPRGTPPDFTEWLSNVTVKEGSTVTHKVIFTGDPKPQITWYINNEEIKASDKFIITTKGNTCTLTIKEFTSRMVGEVICKAENDAGEVSCTANMVLATGKMEIDEFDEGSDLEAMAEADNLSEAGTLSEDITMDEESSIRVSTPIDAPKFITKIKDVKVKRGHKAIFECVVPDTKGVCVKWLKDGKEIELIARIKVMKKPVEGKTQTLHSLVIESVSKADSGVYTCILTNEAGEEICSAELEVLEAVIEEMPSEMAPEFTKNLESCTVMEGLQATLECKVAGVPKPKIEWFKDGKKVEPSRKISVESSEDGTQKLVIRESTVKDIGTYQIVVSSPAGTVKQDAKLLVEREKKDEQAAPSFIVELTTTTVSQGEVVKLECKATGKPAPEIRWFKEDKEIKKSAHVEISSTSDGTQILLIKNADVADAGKYKCEAKNKAGASKTVASLDVKTVEPMEVEAPEETTKPEFSQKLEAVSIKETETAILQCVVSGTPAPEVHWYKDNKEVKPDAQHKIISEPDGTQKLIIQNASQKDIGEYKCEAVSPMGKASTNAPVKVASQVEEKMEVQIAPEFVIGLQKIEVHESETASFECKVVGEPAPKVQWYKDGKTISQDTQHKIEALAGGVHKLIVKKATQSDLGDYTCEAVNIVGTAETKAQLTIITAEESKDVTMTEEVVPHFTMELQTYSVKETEAVSLQCQVEGVPQPEVHWYKDGEEVKPDKTHKIEVLAEGLQQLTIFKTNKADVGEYTAEAVNAAGTAKTVGALKIAEQKELKAKDEVAPEFSVPLTSYKVTEGQTAVLECAVKGKPSPEVHWYKGDEEVKPDKEHKIESLPDGRQKLTIQTATEKDIGEYVVEAVNAAGKATTEGKLEVKLAEQKEVKTKDEVAPEFSTPLTSCKVAEGQTAVLECAVKGKPAPEVHWYKGDEEVKPDKEHKIESLPDGRQKLTIQKATEEDVGEYVVEAVNAAGKATTEGTLEVKLAEQKEVKASDEVAPDFVKSLTSCKVAEGQIATLECAVVGSPLPEVHWYKGGEEVKPDKEHKIESLPDGRQKLTIQKATSKDVGEYTVEAVNPIGKAKTEGSLEVKVAEQKQAKAKDEVAPEFVTELSSYKVNQGETLVLECALSKAAPEIHWYKDGKEVKPDKEHKLEAQPDGRLKLTIQKATESDVGDYKVEAVTPVGKATTEGHVEVKVAQQKELTTVDQIAPQFVSDLTSCQVTEGEMVVLECALKGAPPPEVHWFKDGKEIKPDKDHKIESLPDGRQKLTIQNAASKDIGDYTVEAVSPAGKASTEGHLKVGKHDFVAVSDETAPEFVEILRACEATVHEQVALECKVVGTPMPKVKWLKDGAEVKPGKDVKIESKPDGTQKLVFNDATVSDIGEYRCEAVNEAGSAWTEAPLVVKTAEERAVAGTDEVAPDFLEPLRAAQAEEGEEVRLECKVTGLPMPDVQWYKDGEVVQPSEHVEVESAKDGTQRLVLHNAKLEDIGEYRCEATNIAGVVWSDATLGVQAATEVEMVKHEEQAPQFTRELTTCQAKEGETVSLECKVVGSPKPEVHWYKDDKEIKPSKHITVESKPDGTQRLIVKEAVEADVGDYRCEAVNPAGTAETHAQLNVAQEMEVEAGEEVAPEFVKELRECKADEGETIAFECQVSGAPLPEVHWYKDGKEVKPNKHVEIKSLPDGTQKLVIHDAKPEDQGNYKCEATNVAGSMSSKAPLSVHVAEEMEIEQNVAPEFSEPLHECKAKEGAAAQFECTVVGTPAPKVQWFKDGKPISAGPNYIIESYDDGRQSLTIYHARSEDIGHYYCTATNLAGKAETDADLKVEEEIKKLEFSKGLKNVKVKSGEQIVMNCQIDMSTQKRLPTVKWYRNGAEVKPDKRTLIKTTDNGQCSLTITQASEEDDGKFVCEITNAAGSETSQATVTVELVKAPEFLSDFEDCTVDEGKTVVLEAKVSGAPFPDVKWLKDGKEVKTKGRVKVQKNEETGIIKLVIEGATPEDEGTYRCTISNSQGTASAKATVNVNAKMEVEEQLSAPKFIKGLQDVKGLEGEDLTLSCTIAGEPFPEVVWFKGNAPLKKDDNHYSFQVDENGLCICRIKDATPDDSAAYTCKLTNPAGSADSSADAYVEARIKLKAPEFVRGLEDRSVASKTTVVLEVEVNVTEVTIKWMKNGTEIKDDKKFKTEKKSDTVYRLTITEVTITDQSKYSCVATNNAGTATTEGQLTVEEVKEEVIAPKFRKGLQDQTVKPGVAVKMEVEIEGKPRSVKFYKAGQELKADKRITIEKVDDSIYRLSITGITADDAGDYSVEAENESGSAVSESTLGVESLKFPQILKGLQDVQAEEGAKAVFEVEVSGKPKTIKWYKNGKELTASKKIKIDKVDDSHFKLTVSDVNPEDEATFKVEAGNEVGSVSSEAALTIKKVIPAPKVEQEEEAPAEASLTLTVVRGLEDQKVKENDDLELEVELSAAPALLRWYKGGKELKADKTIIMTKVSETVYKITVKGVQVDDAGVYKVVATNDWGTVGSEAKVTVEPIVEAPKIVKGLQDTEVQAGTSVALEIEVVGKPKAVKWYKNGKDLSVDKRVQVQKVDDSHYRLVINDAKPEDAAQYTVEVSNDAGTADSECSLTVKEAPKEKKPKLEKEPTVEVTLTIVRGLEDQKSKEGGEVVMEVEVSDKPTSIKWYKKDTVIETTKRIKIEKISETVFRLTITKAQMDDAGTYKVEAVYGQSTASSTGKLTVEPLLEAPKIIKGLKNAEVVEGGRIALEVEVTGKPKTVKWYKNGKELKADKRIVVEKLDDSHFRLTLNEAVPVDQADYKIELTNDAGTADSEASLTVKRKAPKEEPPAEAPVEAEASLTIVKPLEDQNVDQGDNVGFEAAFNTPPKSVKWYKNGKEIKPSNKVRITDLGDGAYSLLLTDVAKEDEGVYKIEAEKDGTVAKSEAKLGVQGVPPKFVKGLTDMKTTAGSKIVLEIEVEGKPKVVKWYKNGKEIKANKKILIDKVDEATYRLTFTETQKDDTATYKVEIANDFGSADSEGKLTVEEPPKKAPVGEKPSFSKPLTDKTVDEGAKVSLEVQIEGKPKTVKWYKNGREIKPDKRIKLENLDEKTYKLVIGQATKDDEGQYKVEAENDQGKAETEGSLNVQLPKPTKPAEPEGMAAKFILPLSSETANEDENVSFTCRVKGEPFPEIAWLKDGVEIEASERFVLKIGDDGRCMLTVKNVKKDDAGTYTCLAQNIHGGDRTKCSLYVEGKPSRDAVEAHEPPEFVKPLRNKTVIEGEDVTLEVKIVGKPMPEVCWFRNGDEIEPSDRIQGHIECVADEVIFRLFIKNARLGDTFTYKCVASNPYGTAESQGKLTVEVLKPADQSPAKFVIPITDLSVVEGKSAIFDVKVRGRPTPELIWYKNSKEIVPSERIRIEDMGDNRWRMTIENVTSADAGLFECKAVNSLGFDLCQGNLAIQPSKDRKRIGDDNYAPIFNVPLHDRKIPEGNTMTVECFVNAKPRAQIKWFKEGLQLEDNGRIQIETYPDGKCRLKITEFTKEDVSYYKCVATNDLGTATTKAHLSVETIREEEKLRKKEYPPKFLRDLTDRKVLEGKPVTFECQVDGVPFPEIRWFKNGIPIKEGEGGVTIELLDDGTCRLTIAQTTEADMGAYRCVARNVHGSTNCACLLAVEAVRAEKKKEGEAPMFLKGLSDCWVEKGSDVILKCQVSGAPRPSIKWFKDGTLMRAGNRTDIGYLDDGTVLLTIKDSTFVDEGFYRCVAENSLGEASTIGTVRVQALRGRKEGVVLEEGDAPKFVIPLEDWSCSEGSTVEFECKVTGKPTPQLKWFKDGVLIYNDHRLTIESISDGKYKLSITNVTTKDDGNYRCVATNDAGTATTKAVLKIAGPPASTAPPGSLAPSFAVPLRDVRALEGNLLQLECKIGGLPLPEVIWYKDGEVLQPSDRYRTEILPDGTARLIVDKCTPADEGLYRCLARNPLGTSHMKANVSVKRRMSPVSGVPMEGLSKDKPPRVVVPLETTHSKEGYSVTLTCRIVGTPTPTVKWFKDGERIYPFGRYLMEQKEDGTITLAIDQLTVSDGGCYRCVAENDHGQARTTGEVIVEAKEKKAPLTLEEELIKGRAPGFIKPLTVRRVAEGNEAVFTCLPFGNPFPKIQWLKDGVELSSGDRISLESLEDGQQRLIVRETMTSDEGYYRCVASNDHGTSSTKAELIVEVDYSKRLAKKVGTVVEDEPQESKPRFRRPLQNVTVGQSSPAEFECAIAGFPKPTVKWFKGNTELHQDDKCLKWEDEWGFQRLVVLNSQTEDEGEYRCEISNKLGTAKSEATLGVLKDRHATHEMQLEYHGRRMEGEKLPGEERLYPPGFLRQLKNRHVFSGFPAIFDCLVVGNEMPSVKWYKNGQLIEQNDRIRIQKCGGGSHALVFFRTIPEDQGEYVAIATNSQGTSSSSAVLEVTVPMLDKMTFDGRYDISQWLPDEFDFRRTPYYGIPTPPDRGPFIAEVTGHYLTLSWIPTRRPPPRYPQITYIVEMRELPDKDWEVVDYNIAQPCCKVRNLELGKSFQFRVRAENLYGISEPSPPSAPSQLMAPPKPVLDKNRRPIHNADPYEQQAMNKHYAEQYACAPWFAPREIDKVYCAVGDTLEVTFWVYGYPDPDITWYFRGWEITPATHGNRFDVKCYGGTECVLSIREFTKEDAGQYQCKAVNQHGDAQQNVFVEVATLPTFIQHLENKIVPSAKTARLDCRVDANPYPEIKWFKDWHPLVESSRIKMVNEPPYLCSLLIHDPILRDTGIYTCQASNEAGKVSSTATITVEAEPFDYEVEYVRQKKVTMKPRKVREVYTVEEEVQNITGGALLDRVTASEEIRETQIAFFMRQLLQALEFMHSKNVVHLDLKPENIMLSEAGTDQIKLTDFGLSRRLRRDKQTFGTVGAPEFVAPEIVRQKPVTLATDMWSVGVLAYVMLTGISPFHGDSDEETLQNVVNVKYAFDPKHFKNVSPEAKDFISKLLNGDQKKRLSVQQALSHPWMQLGDTKDHGELLTTQFLKEFKYRHKWVERRVFVQYGPDDESTQFEKDVKGIRSALDLLEPTYFPPLAVIDSRRPVTVVEPPPVAATLKLPSSTRTQGREPGTSASTDRQGRRTGTGSDVIDTADRRDYPVNGSIAKPGDKDQLYQNGFGYPEGERPKRDGQDIQGSKDRKSDSRSGTDKKSAGENLAVSQQLLSPQELSALLSAERRAIEEELANRILSDISEEGSVASEAGSNPPSRKFSMENLLDDREKTPTQDDYSILMRPNRPLRLEIDDIAGGDTPTSPRRKGKGGSKGLKSPVRQSPTKEQVMECIVSSAKALLSPNKNGLPEVDLSPKIKAAKREAEMARKKDDDDFDALMQDVDRMKKDFRRRLSEIRDGYDSKPKADMDNGYDKTRGPGPPIVVPQYPYPGYEVEDYEWDTDYQMGPETFLLQQRNADLAGRIRDYRRHLFGDSASYVEKGYLGAINRDVAVRERRRYTDLIRDDKDLAKAVNVLDKDMKHIQTGAVKRVRMTPVMAAPVPGPGGVCPPVFQHRLKDTVFAEDSQVTFQCVVVGTPEPSVCWFHNEALVVEGPRHKAAYEHHKATLTIKTAQLTDVGVYKCVAENEHGQSTCVARLKQGDLPTRPSRPDVILASDTEVFITWEQPPLTSGLGILCYKLEFRKCGEDEWSCPWFVISDTLDEECVVVKRLEFLGIYQFRVVAKNAFGWGEPSLASRIIQTHVKGAPKLNIELLRKDYHLNVVNLPHHVSLLSEIPEEEGVVSESAPVSTSETREESTKKPSLDLNTTENPKIRYQLDSEIFRGRFCLIRNAMDKKNDTNAHCVAKICMASPDHKEQAMNEYEILREIQHENVVHLMSAYFKEDFLVLFVEKLHDDLLDRFTYQDYYTEDHVARVIAQILSALQWIHFKRICVLDLQPDNIMFPSKRIWSVKIVDTGSAVRMVEGEQTKVPSLPVEYSAPEVLQTGTASPMTDIWGVGLLGFLLLSGVNPYVLDDDSTEADIIRCITMEKCDINYVYTNASQEALKFVTWCLKKQPSNRMTTEDGLQHKWLSVLDVMIRRRETIKFSANRLRTFTRKYRQKRQSQATDNNQLLTEYGQPPSR